MAATERDGLCWDTIKEDTGRGNIAASVENKPDEDINSYYKIMPSGEHNIIIRIQLQVSDNIESN